MVPKHTVVPLFSAFTPAGPVLSTFSSSQTHLCPSKSCLPADSVKIFVIIFNWMQRPILPCLLFLVIWGTCLLVDDSVSKQVNTHVRRKGKDGNILPLRHLHVAGVFPAFSFPWWWWWGGVHYSVCGGASLPAACFCCRFSKTVLLYGAVFSYVSSSLKASRVTVIFFFLLVFSWLFLLMG